jgi:hypothetical protein
VTADGCPSPDSTNAIYYPQIPLLHVLCNAGFCVGASASFVPLRAFLRLFYMFFHSLPSPVPQPPPPNPSFITFSTRTSLMTAGQNSQPPPGAPSSPPPLSSPAPLLRRRRSSPSAWPSSVSPPPPFSALSGSSSPLRIPRRTVHCGAVAKVPATGRAVYSLRVRSFLSTLTSFQNDSHRRLGDGRCSPQTICVPSFIPVLFAL